MKVKRNMAIISLIICMIASVAFAFYAQTPSKAMADDVTHTLSFDNYSIAENLATAAYWGNDNYDSTENAVKMTKGTDSVFVQSSYAVSAEVEKTYHVRFELKTTGNIYANFVINPKWIVLKQGWTGVENNLVWEDDITITEDIGSGQYFAVQLTVGSGDLYIKNFTFTEKIADQTVTENIAIGTLPEITAKTGYRGYWTIDGSEITAESLYSYTENKTATLAYVEAYTLMFEADTDLVSSATLANATYEKQSDGSLNVAYSGEWNGLHLKNVINEANKSYRLSFEAKNIGSDTTARRLLVQQFNASNGQVKNAFFSGINSTDYTKITFEFTSSGAGDFLDIEEATDATVSDRIYNIKNVILTEIVSKKQYDKTNTIAIGTLPEVPAKEGYTGYWVIDETKITADTIYTFTEDKTAVLKYVRTDYLLTLESDADLIETATFATANASYEKQADGSLKVTYGDAWTGLHFTNIITKENTKYRLSFEIKNIGSDATARRILVKQLDSNGGTVNFAFFAGVSNTDYTKITFELTSKGAGDFLDIEDATSSDYATVTDRIYSIKNIILTEIVEAKATISAEGSVVIGTLPEIPEKTGYSNGCYKIGETTIKEGDTYAYTEDKVAKLVYEANKYKLTVNGTEIDVTYDTKIGELPDIANRTGYTGYWKIDNEKITADTVWNYTENKTAELDYEANKYSLSVGGEEIEVTYDKKIGVLPDVPEQTGKRGYWAIDGEEITADNIWNYTENKTATAMYSDICVVKFDGKETTETYVYGDKVTKPADPTKASTAEYDYEFDGWYTANGKWDFDNDTLSDNTELESQFKPIKRIYTVKFNVSGKDGVVIPDMKVEYGKELTLDTALEGIEIGEYTYAFKVDGNEVTSITVDGDTNVEVVFTAQKSAGCGSALSLSSIGVVAILAIALAIVMVARKKNNNY